MARKVEVDILVLGGGITGLWLSNVLKQKGFSALLVESEALGGGQTIASQGVIHGGLKYALNGVLSDSSENLRDMPERWRDCMAGKGELDLQSVQLLADHQILWSEGSMSADVQLFFANKALASRSGKVAEADRPAILQKANGYKGAVYRLDEPVLDVPSLIRALAEPIADRVVYGEAVPQGGGVRVGDTEIKYQRVVLCAGAGNEALIKAFELSSPAMQRRPLKQVLLRHPDLPPLYSVCMGTGTKPVLVTTTHEVDGVPVWYLGGNLSEEGIVRSDAEQIAAAQKTMKDLLPHLPLAGAQWACVSLDRAEVALDSRERPASIYVGGEGPVLAVWPTKLALAPRAVDAVMEQFDRAGICPSAQVGTIEPELIRCASAVWESVNWV
jgi:glycerol-3-phosphate dehydrogenase